LGRRLFGCLMNTVLCRSMRKRFFTMILRIVVKAVRGNYEEICML
jgi:hypothetical protein